MSNTRFTLNGRNLLLAAGLAIACFAFASGNISAADKPSPAPAKADAAPGRLIIVRAANLGPQIVNLKIDGVQKAQISYNRRYDAPLAAGAHVLTVSPVIGRTASPTVTRVIVAPGKTYTFTAAWQDTEIVLQ
ncbi:MAG: hypothetical protein ABI540_09375 [Spartobacteria bacterium]